MRQILLSQLSQQPTDMRTTNLYAFVVAVELDIQKLIQMLRLAYLFGLITCLC